MSVRITHEDILPHINANSGHRLGDAISASVPSDLYGGLTLAEVVTVSQSCITLLSFSGASIQVCYGISGNSVQVKAVLSTPVGDITLGSATLDAQHPTITLGGGAFGFKAEVTISFDVSTLTLNITASVCAPFVGCKSGSTSIKL